MIAFLRGRVADKQPNRVTVDVQGVGYDVHVPLSTFYEIGDEGADVALRIHTHVREDALQLFGFLTDLERQLFERLIGISGIGPKLAIAVLSGMDPRELLAAVQRGDVARLTGIPGIGKKTAERIVLELRDRLAQIAAPAAAGARRRTTRSTRQGCARARSTSTSGRTACATICTSRSPPHGSGPRRSTTCCSTARPGSARRRWPT
jgi:Holliday junction DNA helicase RuvA